MAAQLREILLRTRRHLLLARPGEQPSRLAGEGLDFRELREYTLDDDIRHLNWKSMARIRKPLVNRYNESRQISVGLVYLNSGSLAIGAPVSKKDLAVELLTALSYAAARSGERVSTWFLGADECAYYPPGRRQGDLAERNHALATALEAKGEPADSEQLLRELGPRLRRRSVLFLLGDFMKPLDLSALASRHEIHALILRDRLDEELPGGSFLLEDTGSLRRKEAVIDPAAREHYRRLVREQDAALFEHFRRHGIGWEKFGTSQEPIARLAQYLRRP
ncbi:DUF58 domain-containing protein [Nitratifractor salsuginis]|uniref:DUF58 domain-containing protein n=1 Tax=Nitratifractor salsuginis (strain DSM 16511 / JCM 12458 / E9I37-1) TaxID=749222 RepID=E6X2M6_NITSE|nr:DUF58 domain-containing protein [Nitratifractor salsuginis]ADV46092.1 protein of unknown function DUF58 [Nitratifractor salsuginis DSM 16511]